MSFNASDELDLELTLLLSQIFTSSPLRHLVLELVALSFSGDLIARRRRVFQSTSRADPVSWEGLSVSALADPRFDRGPPLLRHLRLREVRSRGRWY